MYIDMIGYSLAEGVTEADLRTAAADIMEIWMSKQPGFSHWEINKIEGEDNLYTDFVYWENKEAADVATGAMAQIPDDHAWLGCYDMSTVKAQKVVNIFSTQD